MTNEKDWKTYRRTTLGEMRPYVVGEDLSNIGVNDDDARRYGSPKDGDMVARAPGDSTNQWLVTKEYFEANFEEVEP